MKKKIWLLLFGIFLLIVGILFAAVYFASSRGYGVSSGKLYLMDNTVYLVTDDNSSMIVSDQSKNKNLFENSINGDKVLLFHDGIQETFPARTGGYYLILISKGDGTYEPSDETLGLQTTLTDTYAQ